MILRLLLIGCLVVGYMRFVSPFLIDDGVTVEWIVMGGWFVGVVPLVLLVWRFDHV